MGVERARNLSIESDDLAGQARDGKVRWTACPTHRLDDLVHQVEATCGLTVQRTDRAKCARLHARREKIAAPVCRQRRARLQPRSERGMHIGLSTNMLDRCPPLPAVPMDGTEGTAEWTHLVDEQLGGRDVLV